MPAEDALELLMPDADSHALHRVRNVTHFLRLLSDDARSRRAASVGIDLDCARRELEHHDRRGLERALSDLVRHHLDAVAAGTTFVSWGEPASSLADAWRVVGEFRDELRWLACLPEPGEPALAVAARLIASLERLDAEADELALWHARLARLAHGVRKAECAFRAELERALRVRPPAHPEPKAVRPRLAHVVECLLDRGAVREARALLFAHLELVAGDDRLRQLLGWTKLALGESAHAKSQLTGARAPIATGARAPIPTGARPPIPTGARPPISTGAHAPIPTLPEALVDLREQKPDWLPCLAGRKHERAPCAGLHPDPVRSRSDIGAALLAVFVLEADGVARALRLDVVPAWRERSSEWLRDREDAVARAGGAEHRMFVGARTIVAHREPARAIEGTLGGEATLSMALVPWTDEHGEIAGWLHVECEHHLLPARARLERIAQDLGREATSVTSEGAFEQGPLACVGRQVAELGARDPALVLFRQAIHELGIKTTQRRWSGFLVEGERIELVATGGDGIGLRATVAGERRALQRAIAARGTVAFDEPDRACSIDADAASGVALAISTAGRCSAVLAIESSRRRDFRASELARYRAVLDQFALASRLAQFRRWHRARFGFDVWFDGVRHDFRRFGEDLLAAARAHAPVVLYGPSGAGKQILARWLHFECGERSSRLEVLGCEALPSPAGLAARLQAASGSSVLFDDLEALDRRSQEELLRELEDRDRIAPGARDTTWCFTTRLGLDAAVGEGRLRSDLAARLARVQLRVPGLEERREDIVPLVECLADRFAAERGRRAPDFADETLALLWRQTWPGNVRQLESFVYKLVLLAPERRLEADAVVAIAERHAVDLRRRVPSRQPRRSDVLAALRVTRKPGGKVNKTRAALYLGWDPDTLVSRMVEAEIDEDDLGEPDTWRTTRAEETVTAD